MYMSITTTISHEYYVLLTLLKKKRKCSYNSQCHGNMEIRYYQKFYHFISMPFFENFAPPLTQTQLRYCR